MTVQSPTPFPAQPSEVVCFDRREFQAIFSVYGRMVAAGEWRDYALTTARDVAVFAIFRRAADVPLYSIEKRPELRNRQGMFAVLGQDGRVLRRGQDLVQVLRVLEKVMRIVE